MKECLTYNSLNLYSLIILAILFFNALKYLKTKDKFQSIIWLEIITCMFIITVADIISWLIICNDSQIMLTISKICNCILYSLAGFLTVRIALFFDYSINYSKSGYFRLNMIFLPLVIINLILSILSIFYNIYFHYDNSGNYFHGNFYFVYLILLFIPIIFKIIKMILQKRTIIKFFKLLILGLICPAIFLVIHHLVKLPFAIMFPSLTLALAIYNTLLISNNLYVDYLTKLQNKRGIDKYFSSIPNTISENFVLIYLDVDNFKYLNDNFGHTEGDYVLSLIGKFILKSIKINDLAARFGGDEFVIATICNDNNDYQNIIDVLLNNIDNFNKKNIKPYKISISYGLSITKPKIPINKEHIIKQADINMYKHKETKKYEN